MTRREYLSGSGVPEAPDVDGGGWACMAEQLLTSQA